MDLKKRRLELGLKQWEVAKMVGVSMQSYILWERGVSKPNTENERKMLEVLGIERIGVDTRNNPGSIHV